MLDEHHNILIRRHNQPREVLHVGAEGGVLADAQTAAVIVCRGVEKITYLVEENGEKSEEGKGISGEYGK